MFERLFGRKTSVVSLMLRVALESSCSRMVSRWCSGGSEATAWPDLGVHDGAGAHPGDLRGARDRA